MSIPVKEYAARVAELYQKQAALGDSGYLKAHSATRGSIRRQVEAAALYLPHVKGRVLDWGCMHAVDSCLVRMHLGDDIEIHGCDLFDDGVFAAFHQFARLQYKQTQPGHVLPYPDNYFGTIIADGVIEHVPDDRDSLKELYRVLQPNGTLIISCLPNRLSYLECLARMLGLPHHIRTYSMSFMSSMLLHSGFEIMTRRYLQMMPTLSGTASRFSRSWLRSLSSALWSMNGLMESIWPINRFSSNLMLMAQKRLAMTWTPRLAA